MFHRTGDVKEKNLKKPLQNHKMHSYFIRKRDQQVYVQVLRSIFWGHTGRDIRQSQY